MKRVVLYARVATNDQLALDKQVEKLTQYAMEHGYQVLATIADKGVSGYNNAENIENVLHSVESSDANGVLSTDISKITRDLGRMHEFQGRLQSCNAEFESIQTSAVPPCADELLIPIMNHALRQAEIEQLRKSYPVRTRIRLIYTDDPFTRLRPGDMATVRGVDDAGQLLLSWDVGSSLSMIPGVDQFEKV